MTTAPIDNPIRTQPIQGNLTAEGESTVVIEESSNTNPVKYNTGYDDNIHVLTRLGTPSAHDSVNENGDATNFTAMQSALETPEGQEKFQNMIDKTVQKMIENKRNDMAMTQTIESTKFPPGFKAMKSPMGVLVMTPNCVTITMDEYYKYFQSQTQQYA